MRGIPVFPGNGTPGLNDNKPSKGLTRAHSPLLSGENIPGGPGDSIPRLCPQGTRTIFGADRRDTGVIEIDGQPVKIDTPGKAVRQGIALLPESRKDQGLLMKLAVGHNVSLPHLNSVSQGIVVQGRRELRETAELLVDLEYMTPKDVDTALVMQMRWVFREILLCGPPSSVVKISMFVAP